MTFTPEDYRMAQLICLTVWGTIITMILIWRDASLRHHSIDAKLKNADWNHPTGKKE